MGYFDETYFDPTYFDTGSSTAGGSHRVRRVPVVLMPVTDDEEEALLMVRLL